MALFYQSSWYFLLSKICCLAFLSYVTRDDGFLPSVDLQYITIGSHASVWTCLPIAIIFTLTSKIIDRSYRVTNIYAMKQQWTEEATCDNDRFYKKNRNADSTMTEVSIGCFLDMTRNQTLEGQTSSYLVTHTEWTMSSQTWERIMKLFPTNYYDSYLHLDSWKLSYTDNDTTIPQLPTSRTEPVLEDEWTLTDAGKHFISKLEIFATVKDIKMLYDASTVLADGTFYASPILFDQI